MEQQTANTEKQSRVKQALEEQERLWNAGQTITVGDVAMALETDYSAAWGKFQRFIVEQSAK